jgi:hypothetical protein
MLKLFKFGERNNEHTQNMESEHDTNPPTLDSPVHSNGFFQAESHP